MFEGPLGGLRVLELGGIGAAPFACTMLADAGADVVRIERPAAADDAGMVLARGRRRLVLDLKRAEDRDHALAIAQHADVVVEGFRPGVIERLGLGPDLLLARQPRLVIGRITGWGQHGPYASRGGHDINYIGLSGALDAIGPAGGAPIPPLNLVGDFGGGAMMLLFGVLAALHERSVSGRGQIVDAAMTDGCIALMGIFPWMAAHGRWNAARGGNWMDGGSHYYNTYECADGRYVAVGAVEPAFHATLLQGLDLASDPLFEVQDDPARWPAQKARMGAAFRQRTRDAWCAHFESMDACVTPVLAIGEVAGHPHNAARAAVIARAGIEQPSPVPRFSRTPGRARNESVGDRAQILRDWACATRCAAHRAPTLLEAAQ